MRTIWIVALLSEMALAQVAREPVMQTPVLQTSGAFFALSVADIKASTDWYQQKLGLKAVMQRPMQDKVAVAVLEGGGLIVELIEHEGALPLAKAAPTVKDNTFVHGIFKVGVVVDDYEKTLAKLKSRGVEIAYGPYPTKADQRANVIVKDNEGNLIQVFGKK
jgi:catechol 2,3-dioxygenase-like lactoylglutathione lyase family enzyme